MINRAPYYPEITGDMTGSQGNDLSRIGAGDLIGVAAVRSRGPRRGYPAVDHRFRPDPQLGRQRAFSGPGRGAKLAATRYTVLLDVNRAYFDVLRAQATVKVAEQTVAARQLLDDQVTELARNKLRSQVDVSFADVNVSRSETPAVARAG